MHSFRLLIYFPFFLKIHEFNKRIQIRPDILIRIETYQQRNCHKKTSFGNNHRVFTLNFAQLYFFQDVFLVCFSLTCRDSYENIKQKVRDTEQENSFFLYLIIIKFNRLPS